MICKLVIYLFYIKLIYISSLTFPGHNQQEDYFYDSKMWSALTMCYLASCFYITFQLLFPLFQVPIFISYSVYFIIFFQFLFLCFFLVPASLFLSSYCFDILPLASNSLFVFLVPVSSFLSSSCFFIPFQFLVLNFFLVLVSLFLSSS